MCHRKVYIAPFPPPVDIPIPGVEPVSPTLAGQFFTTEPPGKLHIDSTFLFKQKSKV